MKTADVIVIGIGGMGSSACLHLANRGAQIVGIEQFTVGHTRGSSHGQSRIFRMAYFEHPSYVPLLKRAYDLWSEQSTAWGKPLYHETGLVYACPPQSALLKGLRASAREHGVQLDAWTSKQLGAFRAPEDSQILFEPKAGYLEVDNCVRSACTLASRKGAIIVENERVASWSATRSEVQVVTDKQTYTAKKLVITSGPWSAGLLRDLGLPLTLRRKWMYWFANSDAYLQTNKTPCFFFETPHGFFYGMPKANASGGVKVAEHSAGTPLGDPYAIGTAPSSGDSNAILRFVTDALPEIKSREFTAAPCIYTMTPDEHFIVDVHPAHSNVAFAAGFSGHGFKFASVMGEVLADLALAGMTALPASFLGLGRF